MVTNIMVVKNNYLRDKQLANIKFKKILKEAAWDHTSGKSLPTLEDVQKAYESKKHLQEGGFIDMIDGDSSVLAAMEDIESAWYTWLNGPATQRSHIAPAKKELLAYVQKWLNKKIR